MFNNKSSLFKTGLLILLTFTLFIGCSDDDDNPVTPTAVDEFNAAMTSGQTFLTAGAPVMKAVDLYNNLNDGNTANDPFILSIRGSSDYTAGHIAGAVNIGFRDIGYHYVIGSGKPYPNCYYYHYLDGSVEVGRRLSVQGAHCKGQNRHSIGICLIGKNNFTQGQMKSLIDVVEHLSLQYCLNREQVLPHSAFSRKTCPNFDIGPVVDLAFNTLNR